MYGARRRGLVVALTLCLGLFVSACGAALAKPVSKTGGGTAVFAEPPGQPDNYIFPMFGFASWTQENIADFQVLIYRPLYWFGENGQPVMNDALSLALPPVYSNGGRTVTITLKHYLWSDGEPVTTNDIKFWMDLLIANKDSFGPYVPGDFPDNVSQITYNTPRQFSITFNAVYNQGFLLNSLSIITPIPQHAWDRTSATTPVGNYAATTAGAVAVYKYLNSASSDVATYDTDPLWRVVDGPWKMQSITTQGSAVLVPNRDYSGPEKPHLTKIIEQSFTSDAAEYDAVRSGEVTYGYLPTQDVNQEASLKKAGFNVQPWAAWQDFWAIYNFTNPTIGPVFKQLYVRQALQMLINQPLYASKIFHGTAYPTYGPVPSVPKNPYVSPYTKSNNTYPYDPGRAKALLTSHGWHVVPEGTTTCVKAGSGPGECGAGIPHGRALSFQTPYESGIITEQDMLEAMQSSFRSLGIQMALQSAPNSVLESETVACVAGQPCRWGLVDGGIGWLYFPEPYPDGAEFLESGSGSDIGGYSSAEMDRLIAATHTAKTVAALYAYENYAYKHVVSLYGPTPVNQISVIKDSLHGTLPQDPLFAITPENWTLSG